MFISAQRILIMRFGLEEIDEAFNWLVLILGHAGCGFDWISASVSFTLSSSYT